MFEGEPGWYDEIEDQFSEAGYPASSRDRNSSFTARRKIERLRELRQLRVLLDDPEISEIDELD